LNRARQLALIALLAVGLGAPAGAGAQSFDAALEAKNYAKLKERTLYLTGTPAFQARLQQQNAADAVDFPLLIVKDPERNPLGNICAQRKNECAGDVRFYDWADQGYGIKLPVLFTARSGATISGTVWATRAGPAKRPGVVITTGSVQAPETLYWGLAAALAKAGYVVLTYDVQGQGRSDTFGEAPDANEGVPSQRGQPFYDGTEDALDFLLSRPGKRYVPRPSCGNANGGVGTSHDAKQRHRVTAGLNAAFNPLGALVDPDRIGVAGHSLGAGAVSSVGQRDPRVDAVVGWDNLGTGTGGGPDCPSAPATRAPKPLNPSTASTFKPALGMSADYGLTQTPKTAPPDAEAKNTAFQAFKAAGVDSMQVNIRGGSHYEFSLIPGNTAPDQLGNATLRGIDAVSWYTIAWFDRYVKGDPTAAARLLTDRWRADARTAEIDTNDDANLFSFYYRSRYDLALGGGARAVCDAMRTGCPEMAPDGRPVPYGHYEFATTPDRFDGSVAANPRGGLAGGGAQGGPGASGAAPGSGG
jgi:dienelactone hydrolase